MSVPRPSGDRGFTLVELMISIVLSGIVAGVIVAALMTSMNAVDATGELMADSTDASLVSAYLYRDAQASGGGVVTAASALTAAPSVDPWGDCAQDGTLVVRFGWTHQRAGQEPAPVVSTWAIDPLGQLVRRVCQDSGSVDVVLGRRISWIEATCAPDPACGAPTEAVSLAVSGSGTRSPYRYTLTAALRPQELPPPSTAGSAALALAVLGDPDADAPCPSMSLSGAGTVVVVGDAMVDESCGSTPVAGDQTLLRSTGQTNLMPDVFDPYGALPLIDATCSSGANPSPVGESPSSTSVLVHPQPVTIDGPVDLQPGRYVFCGGVTVADGAQLTGDDVVIEVRDGPFVIERGAEVDLHAPVTGDLAYLLVRSTAGRPVALAHSAGRMRLDGILDTHHARGHGRDRPVLVVGDGAARGDDDVRQRRSLGYASRTLGCAPADHGRRRDQRDGVG